MGFAPYPLAVIFFERLQVKRTLPLVVLMSLGLLPLACSSRPFGTPVSPNIQPTPTPTSTNTGAVLICTLTPTTTVVTMTQGVTANSSFATAQNLGTITSGEVDVNGNLGGTSASPDNDYYSFTAGAGATGTWTVYLDCYLSPPEPFIYIYNSSYQSLATQTTSPSGNDFITFSATAGQVYYLRVSGYDGNYTAKFFP
jgi:hypothetical protein